MMTSTAEKRITVSEFLQMELEEGYLYELINGEIMKRSSPNSDHQNASSNLQFILSLYVRTHQLGKVFSAPFDVFFTEFDLAVPDLIFVSTANLSIVTKRCIEGAPDLVIEILSPSTQSTDRGEKMRLYKAHKVKEYWIVDPRNQSVEVYEWQEGDYEMVSFAIDNGEVQSTVLEGLSIDLMQIFK